EEEVLARFEKVRPKILGALLDAVSAGLKRLPNVKLERLPRMADFARWVTACEVALGWEPGSFMEIYLDNISDADELPLGESLIVTPLRWLLNNSGHTWAGTATNLLAALADEANPKATESERFPKSPNSLSNELRRLAPNLRRTGIDVYFDRSGQER